MSSSVLFNCQYQCETAHNLHLPRVFAVRDKVIAKTWSYINYGTSDVFDLIQSGRRFSLGYQWMCNEALQWDKAI